MFFSEKMLIYFHLYVLHIPDSQELRSRVVGIFLLLRVSKYVVELAVASARFMPLGPTVLHIRAFYNKGYFHENPRI
jgi:hypothetical protein